MKHAAFLLALWAAPAAAHQAPTGWSYPLNCCANNDCREVAATAVAERPDGYHVPSGEVVGYRDARVKESPDGALHWCTVAGTDAGKTLCLFVPPRGM